ncbi:MAG: hypothetical protein JF607_17260 [Burkholderiales bacterium]|jgi:hypothetical protein|nr:hypothetical protein [Burkholderiales bacterium]
MKAKQPIAKAPATAGRKPNVATGDTNQPDQRDELPLPHERDQAVNGTAAKPNPVIRQAKRDLDAGLVDTDLHGTPGLDASRRKDLLRRGRG